MDSQGEVEGLGVVVQRAWTPHRATRGGGLPGSPLARSG